jgi:hypothetical protein
MEASELSTTTTIKFSQNPLPTPPFQPQQQQLSSHPRFIITSIATHEQQLAIACRPQIQGKQAVSAPFACKLFLSVCGFCLFNLALQVLFQPQRLKQMAVHMGSIRWVSSPYYSHLPPLSSQMHREATLHSLHSENLNLIHPNRPNVRPKQPPLLLGKFLSPRLHLISPTLLPADFQSHTLRYHCEAKDHILKSQLRDSSNPQFCSPSLGFQP